MNCSKLQYDVLAESFKDYIDTFNELYRLHAYDENEIDLIYKNIQNNLIKTNYFSPSQILKIISTVSKFNNRYMKSYWTIFKKIYEEYQVKQVIDIEYVFDYFVFKEYGINFNEYDKIFFRFYDSQKYSLEVHEENTIYRAIMNDDKESFILFTEREGFDENQKIMSELYPFSKAAHSLLELCCYHGAVDCFKILRSKYNSEITIICLRFSFLSGNPEIMSECLKKHKPDQDCMFFAICSHNIDFVTFLVNEYKLEIDLEQCVKLHNLQAFLVYFSFVYSPSFHIPSLCECFLNNGADINSKEYYGKTALHYAAESKEIVELLLLHKIDINTKDMFGRSAFNYAAAKDCKEVIQILISNGADEKINGYIRPIARDFAHHGMNL